MTAKNNPNRYTELFESFPPRPIRTEKDMDRVQKVVNALLDRVEGLSRNERDYLEVLGILIEAYEKENEPMPDVSDAAMLAHLIEAKGVSQRAAAEGAGIPETTISDLLAGRRQFNRRHIEKLSAYFGVSPAVFFKAAPAVRV